MDKTIFWELFRDTGDPICWLIARKHPYSKEKDGKIPERKGDDPSASG